MRLRRSPELRTAVRRLTLQFTGLMLVIVMVLGGVVYAIVSQSAAEASTKALVDATRLDSPLDAPMGTWMAVWRNDSIETSRTPIEGLPDLSALEQAVATRKPVRTTIESGERTFDVLTIADEHGQVQVARDQHETREELDRLLWALVVAGAVAIAFSAAGSALMARRAIKPLADALEMQRRFVADASHELRTPLTLLSTRAQLARRRLTQTAISPDSAKTLEDLDHVVNDAHKLTEILEDLLIAADTRSAPPQTVIDVASMAQAAVTAAETEARHRSVIIRSEGMPSGANVIASRAAIERLFLSLLDNAIDHARSRVDVTVAVEGKNVTARVRDDGPGFSEISKNRAFERFATTRGVQSSSDAPRHYGIGLALVAEIASRAGGTVRVEDMAEGEGASILVTLPYTHRLQ